MTLVRAIVALMSSPEDGLLGLYGAFGYDLVFQFEELTRAPDARSRPARRRPLHSRRHPRLRPRVGKRRRAVLRASPGRARPPRACTHETPPSVYAKQPRQGFADHGPGEYVAVVEKSREAFARGDLFEAVPGQLFGEACERTPSEVFRRLCQINPSPYGALINLGDGEFLVSASPEMFVRSDGHRVETCPISGTIARGVRRHRRCRGSIRRLLELG